MGTCHKCAAPLGRGTPRHAQCPTCGLTYHTSDCGGRYASCPEIKASLEDCPKCNKVCLCTGGALLCHVGRSRIRRRTAKAARTSNPGHPGLDQFGTPWGYPGVGTLLPRHELKPASLAHFGVGDVALGGAFFESIGRSRARRRARPGASNDARGIARRNRRARRASRRRRRPRRYRRARRHGRPGKHGRPPWSWWWF